MEMVFFKTDKKPIGKELKDLPVGGIYQLASEPKPEYLLYKANASTAVCFVFGREGTSNITVSPVSNYSCTYVPYTGEIRMEFVNGK